MYRLLSVLPIVLLLSIENSAHAVNEDERVCVHSTHVEPRLDQLMQQIESIPLETHRGANAGFFPMQDGTVNENPRPAPLRIHMEYQLDNLAADKAKFMKEKLMPAVQGVFKRMLKVKKPVKGNLFLPWLCITTFDGYSDYCHEITRKCGDAEHNATLFGPGRICMQPYEHQCQYLERGKGVPNADFVLYVTAIQDEACSHNIETLASAGFCILDQDNWYGSRYRPLAGVANFCPGNIKTDEAIYGFMIDTAVHEVFHALLMSKPLFHKFILDDGSIRTNVVEETDEHITLKSPKVVKASQEILGCEYVNGARLENEGGYGTANCHWERRYFMGELMVGSSSITSRSTISNVTLALAEDSGWYLPRYQTAGMLAAVEHRGCEFFSLDCHTQKSALASTFCWVEEQATEQRVVCTPDHTAIGYCKTDMSLIGACSIIQAFSNTQCTKPEHAPEIQHVDLGFRHQPYARCFPVKSFKISRTGGRYTVYRSSMGAACFDAVCHQDQLYIRIHATLDYSETYIECPSGEDVDLASYDIGFEEGVIGPCPDNAFVCSAWGCPDDCNGRGHCFEKRCYCDVGYAGEGCESEACPENQCPAGQSCNLDTGLCYVLAEEVKKPIKSKIPLKALKVTKSPVSPPQRPKAVAKPPSAPKVKPAVEKPKTTPPPAPQPVESAKSSPKPERTPSVEIDVPFFPFPWSEPLLPSKPSEDEEGGVHEQQSPDKGVFYIPFTKPDSKPSTPLPSRAPFQEPFYGKPSTYEVPAYAEPDLRKKMKYAYGTALGVGLLGGCVLFADAYSDLELHEDSSRAYTADDGKWALTPYPTVLMVIDTRMGDTCVDRFTNKKPVWRARAYPGMKSISAISTLVALVSPPPPSPHEEEWDDLSSEAKGRQLFSANVVDINQANPQNRKKLPRYKIDSKLLKNLKLKDDQVLERNFIVEAYLTKDSEAKRAFVHNAIISNTITQCACYLDRLAFPSMETADRLFKNLGYLFLGKTSLDKLCWADTVYTLLSLMASQEKVENFREVWSVARAIARTNQVAESYLSDYNKLTLLEEISRLAVYVETKLCQYNADLASGTVDSWSYESKTGYAQIQQNAASMEIPSIQDILSSHPLPAPPI